MFYCTALTSHWSGLTHSYMGRKAKNWSLNWAQCPGFFIAGEVSNEYWEPPSSFCHSDFCFDAFSLLFSSYSKLTKIVMPCK